MENAGRAVAEAIVRRFGARPTLVLCGPGNNGGDGFVVARLLQERGWNVEAFLYGTPEGMPRDARMNYERWVGMGKVRGSDTLSDLERVSCDVVIDALFGIGLSRPLSDAAETIGDWSARRHGPFRFSRTLCVDVPSGLCADSGRRLAGGGSVVVGDLTVAFHRRKLGQFLDNGPDVCGKLRVVEIGLAEEVEPEVRTIIAADRCRLSDLSHCDVRKLSKTLASHKYIHGHALILSGPPGHGGAARLAARGALRIGAGLVTVGCAAEAIAENAARLDAVMLREIVDDAALSEAFQDRRINAVCLGPGMGIGEREVHLLRAALESQGEPRPTRSVVLDADALTLLAKDPALFALLNEGCVLTPHGGEFARLFPDIAAKLEAPATRGPAYSKVEACREAAARAGCVVLFKGPDTVIADPSGRCSISSAAYERAAPWLATAGSGDVLAGFIAGLMARGFEPFEAACTAAWLHVECALSFGPGLIAEDLPEELPKIFQRLGV